MAGVFAVLALHPRTFEEELATEGAEDDGVKLLLHKLVSVLFVDLLLALAYGSLTAKSTRVVGAFADVGFDWWGQAVLEGRASVY